MNAILNIGLARNDGAGSNKLIAVLMALVDVGHYDLIDASLYQSDTEPTAVVEVADVASIDFSALCERLAQDCIAVLPADGEGYLIGPKAAEWGPFDPAQFISPGGWRLLSETKGEVK